MIFLFKPYSVLFVLGTLLCLALTIVTWRRRPATGATPFALFSFAVFWWSAFWILEIGATEISQKIIWAKLEYLGILSFMPLWLVFICAYTGHPLRKPIHWLLLGGLPLLTLGVVCTNELHGWFWSDIYLVSESIGRVTIWHHGFWFWICAANQYIIISIGVWRIWHYHPLNIRIYRKQAMAITLGCLIPVMVNLVYLLRIPAFNGLDFTPLSISLTALIYVLAIFRYKLLDINAIAQKTILAKIPVGILVVNSAGDIIDLNPASQKILGRSKSEILGFQLSRVWPELNSLLAQLPPNLLVEMSAPDSGSLFDLEISLTTIYDHENVVEGQVVMIRDITQRHKIEQVLRENEKRYSTLVEQSSDGIAIVKNSTIQFVNRAFSAITGYSNRELNGQNINLLLEQKELALIMDFFRVLQSGQSASNSIETRIRRQDRQYRDVEVALGLITFEGEAVAIVTLRDITERKVTQRKLEELYHKEKQLTAALQDEIANRSKYTRALVHELKTPLTAILSSSELLELTAKEEIISAVVKNIRQASLKLEQRTNDLIDLARAEIGMLRVETEALDIADLIQEMHRQILPAAQAKGLQLDFQTAPLPLVNGDRTRLKAVLFNLLNNALKYTDRGVVRIRALDHDAQNLLVQVIDTGKGIAPDQLKDLFDPYKRQSTEGQKYSGIGIGLALCRVYIELHAGKIWAESTTGKGSTFSFTLPLCQTVPLPAPPPSNSSVTETLPPSGIDFQ
jgi:PAS domain S-box-containing protein